MTVDLNIDDVGKNGIMRGVFGALRGNSMPPDGLTDAYYIRIREAMDRGDLPSRGSYLPYIVFIPARRRGKGSARAGKIRQMLLPPRSSR